MKLNAESAYLAPSRRRNECEVRRADTATIAGRRPFVSNGQNGDRSVDRYPISMTESFAMPDTHFNMFEEAKVIGALDEVDRQTLAQRRRIARQVDAITKLAKRGKSTASARQVLAMMERRLKLLRLERQEILGDQYIHLFSVMPSYIVVQ